MHPKAKYPPYVDSAVLFKHEESLSKLMILSDWASVENRMRTDSNTYALYFPQTLDLQHDMELEAKLAHDIQQWPFFGLLPLKLQQLTIHLSHFCSYKSTLSYERRVLLHHHLSWIFLMDDVTETIPLYRLHDTAGKQYLTNLKNIITGGAIFDMNQFKNDCPAEVIESALLAQRILAEDLMPLKKKLLTTRHMKVCADLLVQFFDFEYDEGQKFCIETSSQQVLQTRAITVGGLVPMALIMSSEEAEKSALDSLGLIQASVLMTLMNDIIGLYKDLKAVEQQNDGSAYLNLVRVGIREYGLNEADALRLYINKLNRITWSVEFCQMAYPSSLQGLQLKCLRLAFNYLDYHLLGIMGKPNNRYGWKHEICG